MQVRKYIKYLLLLIPFSLFAKDLVLNFDPSCFKDYDREYVIEKALQNWNEIHGTPYTFIKGDDLEEEVNEHNYQKYLWSPYTSLVTFGGRVPHRPINPIVCDYGDIVETMGLPAYVDGFANKPMKHFYDFFAVYIRERDWSEEQLISLVTHELGHIIGLGHISDEISIMHNVNFDTTGSLTEHDLDEFHRVNKFKDNGDDRGFSFESKVDDAITVKVNIPNEHRGKVGTFLVAASLNGILYIFDKEWTEFTGEFHGKSINLGIEHEMEIWRGEIPIGVEVYWGIGIDGDIYYNSKVLKGGVR